MMKKNRIAAGTFAGTMAVLGALTLAAALPAFAAEITADKAEEIAMEHAGVKEKDVAHIRTERDYEDGQLVYEVEFYTSDYKEYDYEISAADGKVIGYDYDAEYWQYGEAAGGKAVDLEGAKAAALADAGLKEKDVTFLKTKSDWDDGRETFEVEFYTSDGMEYDYEIDAETGRIVSCDFDAEENGKWDGRRQNDSGKKQGSEGGSQRETTASADEITQDEAKKIALEKAGLKENQVSRLRIHKDRDDGRTVYEGEFIYGETEYEFEISAADGRILDWERESIYD